MDIEDYNSLRDFVEKVELIGKDLPVLFRGQNVSKPLLPKIARYNTSKDASPIEKEMIAELRRQTANSLDKSVDEWDLLVLAQHYGMATRLLDWTGNPFAALWFACNDLDTSNDAFIYMFVYKREDLLDKNTLKSPFDLTDIKVIKPNLNNERIVAQNGWFTAHSYSAKDRRYMSLDELSPDDVYVTKISGDKKPLVLEQINHFGINYRSMFTDLEGICRQINWLYCDRY